MVSMANTKHRLRSWVDGNTKQQFVELAERRNLTEAQLLEHLVTEFLLNAPPVRVAIVESAASKRRNARVTIRLKADDQLLLRERARGRGASPAAYIASVTSAHLRTHSPLPTAELQALKANIAVLSSFGRSLNNVVRALQQGSPSVSMSTDELRRFLRLCEALHASVKSLLKANAESWKLGNDEQR